MRENRLLKMAAKLANDYTRGACRVYLCMRGRASQRQRRAYGKASERCRAVHCRAEFGFAAGYPAWISRDLKRFSEDRSRRDVRDNTHGAAELVLGAAHKSCDDVRGVFVVYLYRKHSANGFHGLLGLELERRGIAFRAGISRAGYEFRCAFAPEKPV